MNYTLFTDGGSRGNPGKAAIGSFIFDEKGKIINFSGAFIGTASNNVAEYKALILGLELAKKEKIRCIDCFLDSELIVKQLMGEYKVKSDDMKSLYSDVLILKSQFDNISFQDVPRAKNKLADKLVNLILDAATF